MRLNQFLFIALLSIVLHKQVCAQTVRAQVIGWIPVYGVDESLRVLEENPHIASGITRMGLQFWNPSPDGKGLVFAPVNQEGLLLERTKVHRAIDWAKKRNIAVMLTVYNNSQVIKKWDWELAKRAFKNHPHEFARALLSTVREFDLDGVDLDLEGEGELESDRASYAYFVKYLSRQLKKRKKLLTVDSFHSPCINAPNMRWWRDWRGQVDAIHSMGYEDLFEGSTKSFSPEGKPLCEGGAAIFKYSWQLEYGKKAGYRSDQILLGMPTWVSNWGGGGLGSDIQAHLREVKNLGAGIALWDLQLAAPEWRSLQIWSEIRQLRGRDSVKRN